jgi:hypothetical protein
MKSLLAALGLPDTASEGEALIALQRTSDSARQLQTALGASSPQEALAKVQSLLETASAYDALRVQQERDRATVRVMSADAAYDKRRGEGRLSPALEQATRAGFPITDDASLTRLESFLASLPVIPALGESPNKPPTQPEKIDASQKLFEDMTQEERHRLANDDPKTFAIRRQQAKNRGWKP